MHNRNYVTKYPSFSYAEILISMMLITVILMASFSVMTIRNNKNDYNMNVVSCIKNTLPYNSGLNISESSCATYPNNPCCRSVLNCRYQRDNSCLTIRYFADKGNANEKDYAGKLFREVCDEGGEKGCNYFAFACKDDISKCNITGDNDLHYYLSLLINTTNIGSIFIENTTKEFYSNGYANITSEVNAVGATCSCPTFNIACNVKGTVCSGGETPIEPWAKRFGGANDDEEFGIAVESGNVYLTGYEYDTTGGAEIFAIKLDANGNVSWKKRFGGAFYDQGYGIAVESGNVYFTGSQMSDTTGNFDIFAIKLDANGNVSWKKKFGGTSADTGYGIAVESGNAYLTGSQQSDTAGGTDIFAIKLDTNGNVIWQKKFGGVSGDYGYGIAVESGNAYLTGYQQSDTAGGTDIFAIKLDTNGNVVWKKKFGGASADSGYGIAVESGNVYLTGNQRTDTAGLEDVFAIKLDTNGNVIWKKKLGGTAQDFGYGIAVESGNVYLAGFESSDTTSNDIFAIKLLSTQTSNLNSNFDGTDLSSAFNGSGLSVAFNGTTLGFTAVDLNSSFNGTDLHAGFDGILINKTKFLGLE